MGSAKHRPLLRDYPWFVENMPELLQALETKGYAKKRLLIEAVAKKTGVIYCNVEQSLRNFLDGKIDAGFRNQKSGGSISILILAQLAEVAEIPFEQLTVKGQPLSFHTKEVTTHAAKKPFPSLRAKEVTARASKGPHRPFLRDYPWFAGNMPELLEALETKGCAAKRTLIKKIAAETGTLSYNVEQSMRRFLGGKVDAGFRNEKTGSIITVLELMAGIAEIPFRQLTVKGQPLALRT